MTKTITGKIRGRTIELSEDLGLAEGQQVEVLVKVLKVGRERGEGLQRSAGALAADWTLEDDEILAQIRRDRQCDSRRETLE